VQQEIREVHLTQRIVSIMSTAVILGKYFVHDTPNKLLFIFLWLYLSYKDYTLAIVDMFVIEVNNRLSANHLVIQ